MFGAVTIAFFSTARMSHIAWYLLAAGAVMLTLTWFYFMVSRRGAINPVSKCVLLSLWAHVILVGLAYLTHWFPATHGFSRGDGEVRVRWISQDTRDDESEIGKDETLRETTAATEPDLTVPQELIITAEAVPSLLPDLLPDLETTQDARTERPSEDFATANPVGVINTSSPVDQTPIADEATTVESTPNHNAATTSESAILDSTAHDSQAVSTSDADAEAIFASTGGLAVANSTDEHPSATPPPEFAVTRMDSTATATSGPANSLPARYVGRTPYNRRKLAAAKGGSADTEAAVDAALEWLAKVQNSRDGHWDNRAFEGGLETRELGGITYGVKADTAVTGLALLAFFGAGHTHAEGPYRESIRHGLEFLLRQQSPRSGSLAGDASPYVAMYCHGIAALALSEASIMTGDPQLRNALRRAIDYTVASQHRITGGWRYHPGDLGDTSQFGWQLMALVSADSAGISIPPATWHGAERWLGRVTLGDAGGLACYTPDRPVPSPSMTAEALFCRAFMPGAPRQSTVDEAADFIARFGNQAESLNDLYFCYYATLALYQLQDQRWQQWNARLTRHLVASQQSSGQLVGSWNPDTKWGPTGGRIYTTSMACLCLETYYRYLPVFELAAARGRIIHQR